MSTIAIDVEIIQIMIKTQNGFSDHLHLYLLSTQHWHYPAMYTSTAYLGMVQRWSTYFFPLEAYQNGSGLLQNDQSQ